MRLLSWSTTLLPFFFVLGSSQAAIAQSDDSYTYAVIDGGGEFNPPSVNAKNFWPQSLNNEDVLVGTYTDDQGVHGFTYERGGIYGHRGGTYASVDVPGSGGTAAFGINDAGTVVGSYSDLASSRERAFIYRDGYVTTILPPSAIWSSAWGINNAGDVVGVFLDSIGVHGFLYRSGVTSTLDVPGATATYALDINDDAHVVGQYISASGELHGFEWDGQTFDDVDVPGAIRTLPYNISDAGQVIGVYLNGMPGWNSFLLRSGQFTDFTKPGTTFTYANGLNRTGNIVGITVDASGQHGFLATRKLQLPSATCAGAFARPAILWPPNGNLVRTSIGGITDPAGTRLRIQIIAVTQDEPVAGRRRDVAADAVIAAATALLRAERDARGNGRDYQVRFRAINEDGLSCDGAVHVGVPKSLTTPVVDDGQAYTSTRP